MPHSIRTPIRSRRAFAPPRCSPPPPLSTRRWASFSCPMTRFAPRAIPMQRCSPFCRAPTMPPPLPETGTAPRSNASRAGRACRGRSPDGGAFAKSALHVQQFDIEDQGGVRRDDAAGAARPVAEFGRDDERALAAHLHAGNAFVPTGDDLMLAERKL